MGYKPSQPKNLLLSPKYEKPDTGQQTPDAGNSKSEIFCKIDAEGKFLPMSIDN